MDITINDKDRLVKYQAVNSVGPFYIDFPIFDPVGADLDVRLNDLSVAGWTFKGTQVSGFSGAPYTWVNGYVVFDQPVSGSLMIEGRRAPRRVDTFAEGRGIPARDLNTDLNILTAVQREHHQKLGRALILPSSTDLNAQQFMISMSRLADSADNLDRLSKVADEIKEVATTVAPNMDAILSADDRAQEAQQAAIESEVQANLARAYAESVGGQLYDYGLLSEDAEGVDDWGIL